MFKLVKLIILFSLLFVGSLLRADVAGRHISVQEIQLSDDITMPTGSTVNILGTIEVNRSLSPSGRLATFTYNGFVYNADADLFYEVSENSLVDLRPPSTSDAGNSAKICSRIIRLKDDEALNFASEDATAFFEIKSNNKLVNSFSLSSPKDVSSWREGEQEFCISGLEYSTNYEVKVLKGLELARDNQSLQLDSPLQFTIKTAQVNPSITVSGSKNILSKSENPVIPVEWVNVEEALLSIHQIDIASLNSYEQVLKILDVNDVENLSYYWGDKIFEQKVFLGGDLNAHQKKNIDLSNILPENQNGLFVATLKSDTLHDDGYSNLPSQWFSVSDISLQFFKGLNKTTLLAKSFESTASLSNVNINIIANNNRQLFSGETDEEGRVVISNQLIEGKGGFAPRYIFASSDSRGTSILDASSLDTKPRFLSGGMEKAHNDDIYLTTDRNMYRAGDTISSFGIARDLDLDPIANKDFILKLSNSTSDDVYQTIINTDQFGAFQADIELKPSWNLGRYTVKVLTLDELVLAQSSVTVSDFVPLTIEATFDELEEVWDLNSPQSITLNGNYFSGGTAAGLKSEITTFLKPVTTFRNSDLAGFKFGSLADDSVLALDQFEDVLDENGKLSVSFLTDYNLEKSSLYEINVEGTVFDIGGRANKVRKVIALNQNDSYVGIRAQFDHYLDIGSIPTFDIVSVNRAGISQKFDGIEYSVNRVYYDYNWSYSDGRWRWHSVRVSDDVVEAGRVEDKTLSLANPLSWGRHEITVKNKSGFSTTLEFYVGWGADVKPATEPEELTLSYKNDALSLTAPFDGTLSILIAKEDIKDIIEIPVKKGSLTTPLDIKDLGEPGGHVLVSLVRPIVTGSEHLPQVALGKLWITELKPERSLTANVVTEQKIDSSTPIAVTLNTDAETGTAMLFLVDDGIHALTSFENSNLVDHFVGERALNYGILNNFGQLITQDTSLMALRVGGDDDVLASMMSANKSTKKSEFFKTVAASSPLLNIENGTVTYEFEPTNEWEGRLRLVALVVGDKGFAHYEGNITVQDPVSIDVSMPRFVTPHDNVNAKLNVRWNDFVGAITLKTDINGVLNEKSISQPLENQFSMVLPVTSDFVGDIPVLIEVTAGDRSFTRNYSIVAREVSYPVTETKSVKIDKQNWLGIGHANVKPFTSNDVDLDQNTSTISAILSPYYGEALKQSVTGLNVYPYGCVEQLSSKTRGLIAYAQVYGLKPDIAIKINHGINQITSRQKSSGAFGYWSRTSSVYDEFQPYAIETLQLALPYLDNKAKVLSVINNGLDYLYRNNFSETDLNLYSLGLLAKSGYEVTSRSRYAIDEAISFFVRGHGIIPVNDRPALIDDLALAYWLSAILGDDRRMAEITKTLTANLPRKFGSELTNPANYVDWFDGSDRNPSQFVYGRIAPNYGYLLSDLKQDQRSPIIDEILAESRNYLALGRHPSTIQRAKLVAMNLSLTQSLDGTLISINDQDTQINQSGELDLDQKTLQQGFKISQNASIPLYLNVTARGQRLGLNAQDNGYYVSKWWYDRSGKLLDTSSGVLHAKQGELFTVVIEVERTKSDGDGSNILVTDLLPSGFEIEDALITTPKIDGKEIDFSTGRQAVYQTAMDDRYIAHFDSSWWRGSYAYVRYTVRAANVTESIIPDAVAEEMYSPDVNGRSEIAKAVVIE